MSRYRPRKQNLRTVEGNTVAIFMTRRRRGTQSDAFTEPDLTIAGLFASLTKPNMMK